MSRLEVSALATPEAISALTDQILTFLEAEQVDGRATHHVAFVVEELLTNLGTHGSCRSVPARVTIDVGPAEVVTEIVDSGPPFDPRQAPEPDVATAAEEREIGGLGLFLTRQLSSALEYVHRNGENCTKFAIARAAKNG
jgi:anti-sigma regulatory factor (Ser/Thr protein kinase)